MPERPPAPPGYNWHDLDAFEPRRLEVLTGGPEDGFPLLFHCGTPSAAAPFPWLVDTAAEAGLRTIMYSRPGYGDSNTAIGRQVATAAQDTALIVTALGHDGFVTAGWSGGGPHALACAALIDGCKAAGVIAGPAPRDAEGLDWLAGMAQDNLDEFDLAGLGGEEFDAFLETVASSVPLLTNASDIAGALGDLLTARDVEAVGAHGIGEYLLAAIQGAVRVGTTGWRDDDVALLTPWGTNPSDISKPVLIWHGTEDRMVPYSHAEWLVSHIPGAVLKRADGEGHLSVASEAVPDIVAFLAGAAGL